MLKIKLTKTSIVTKTECRKKMTISSL